MITGWSAEACFAVACGSMPAGVAVLCLQWRCKSCHYVSNDAFCRLSHVYFCLLVSKPCKLSYSTLLPVILIEKQLLHLTVCPLWTQTLTRIPSKSAKAQGCPTVKTQKKAWRCPLRLFKTSMQTLQKSDWGNDVVIVVFWCSNWRWPFDKLLKMLTTTCLHAHTVVANTETTVSSFFVGMILFSAFTVFNGLNSANRTGLLRCHHMTWVWYFGHMITSIEGECLV